MFADTDGAPLEPLKVLEPHIIVQSSPGKWHVYWLVDVDFPLDMFTPIQKAIAAKYGTDDKVNDLSRVMRLPDFYHCKGEQEMVTLEQINKKLPRYSYGQIIEGLDLDLEPNWLALPVPDYMLKAVAENRDLTNGIVLPRRETGEVAEMLRYLNPGCGYADWRDVSFALAEEFGEEGRDLFISWSAGNIECRVLP